MARLGFDVDGARKAGYSDQEIADVLAQKAGFDSAGARQAGYSDAEIISNLMDRRAPTPDPNAGARQVAQETGTGEALLVGAGRTFDRIGKGMQQAYYNLTGNEPELEKLKQRAESDDAVYKQLQKDKPMTTAVGEALPSMAVPIGSSATTLGTIGKLAASGAAPAALSYGSAEERAKRAAIGGAGAAIGGVVAPKAVELASGAAKAGLKGLAGKVTPEAVALYNRAKELGVPVNVAQLGDSKFIKTLASTLEQIPFTGAAKKATQQREAYTRAVSKTFGDDVTSITPEVYAANKSRLGQAFDELSARNSLNVTNNVKRELADIMQRAEATANDDTIRAVRNVADRISEQAVGGKIPAQVSNLVDEVGQPIIKAAAGEAPLTIPGTTYKSIDTELGNLIKAGGEKGLYAKELQTTLRRAMDDSIGPADQAAWRSTRDQYRNLKAVRNVVARESGDGSIPPTQLMNALNSTEAGKEAMAMGVRGELGDLGQVGRRFVRDTIPNSGTAQRAMTMGMLGAGGMAFGADLGTIGGMMIGGASVGRLLNKVINDPRAVEALARQGVSLKDLANMSPSRIAQILGGLTGEAVAIEESR